MISLCFEISEENRWNLDKQFKKDVYIDWNKENEKTGSSVKEKNGIVLESDQEEQEKILLRVVCQRRRRV